MPLPDPACLNPYPITNPIPGPIPGFVLAGGQSRRMGGGQKMFMELAGRPLLDHVIERAQPQVDVLIINAPRDLAPGDIALGGHGLFLDLLAIPDVIEGQKGPLAGVLTGLEWAHQNMPKASHIATFPCDAPFLPLDLVSRLWEALKAGNADIAYGVSGGQDHPAFALWPLKIREKLRQAIAFEGLRRMGELLARHKAVSVEYPCQPVDPFFNVNTPKDLAKASLLVLD